jgi:ParB-like chromosome segregation protein Spo0J
MGIEVDMNTFLQETAKQPGGAAAGGGFDIEHIPLDRIRPSENNFYRVADIEELAASIEELGLFHNLVVVEPDEEGIYELIDGERRYRAHRLLYEGGNEKYASAPCKVEKKSSPAETELKLIHAQCTCRELSDYEKTKQAARIRELLQQMKTDGHKFKGRMREIVACILDVSPAQMGRMESIEKNLAPEIKEAFKEEKIGITAAYEISRLGGEEQKEIADRYSETGEIEAPKPKTAQSLDDDIRQYVAKEIKTYGKMSKQGFASLMDRHMKSWHVVSHSGFFYRCYPAGIQLNGHPRMKWAKFLNRVFELIPAEEWLPDEPAEAKRDEKPAGGETAEAAQNKGVKEGLIRVCLTDTNDGTDVSLWGNLAMIVAVDTGKDNFDGTLAANSDIETLDYVTLAKAVVVEILTRIGDDRIAMDMLRVNIVKLFDELEV